MIAKVYHVGYVTRIFRRDRPETCKVWMVLVDMARSFALKCLCVESDINYPYLHTWAKKIGTTKKNFDKSEIRTHAGRTQ